MNWHTRSAFRIESGYYDAEQRVPIYAVMTVQQGTRSFAHFHWPKHKWIYSDKRVRQMDCLYDGPSRDLAIAACEQHFAQAQAKASAAAAHAA